MGKNLQKLYSFRTDDDIIAKLDIISEKESRTRNKEIEYIIKEYINKYESQHGIIKPKKKDIIKQKEDTIRKMQNYIQKEKED